MNNKKHRYTLMQLEVGLPVKIIVSFVIMAALIAFVYLTNIPNPNMILIAGLVLCCAMFGFGGGIVAAIIMLFYTLYFFSTDNDLVDFTEQNFQKVLVSLIGIISDMLLVCFLKRAEQDAFREVDNLNKKLSNENEYLQNISTTDFLTNIRNRMALRLYYDSYKGHEVTVMMMDIDKFKYINDTFGHEEGDRILKETGALLSSVFGKDQCYRYGGDEFLVICTDTTEDVFKEKLDSMMENRPHLIAQDDASTQVRFSIGFVHDKLDDEHRLRELFAIADERMYEAKRSYTN